MKRFWLLVFCAAAGIVLAIPEDERIHGENGWFVPMLNGSFVWRDKLEAESFLGSMEEMEGRLIANRVRFHLYTQANPNKAQKITADKTSISASNFNAKNPTKITIHGWTSDKDDPVNKSVRKAWLYHTDCNMIAVDWNRARSLDYTSSVLAVPAVGAKVAALVDFLVKNFDVNLESVQIIGHSLGAHVAGFAGKNIKTGKVHSIVGLDPALPLYSFNKPNKRLCSTDAKYVESIHTNAGKLGFLKPIGKAAFYPNGGKLQPGCGIDLTGSCSHERSIAYYAEALNINNFASIACSNYKAALKKNCGSTYSSVYMGDTNNAEKAVGHFYVPVKRKSPFGML